MHIAQIRVIKVNRTTVAQGWAGSILCHSAAQILGGHHDHIIDTRDGENDCCSIPAVIIVIHSVVY